ncbi:DUF1259 domain-containing protein [Salicibibacter cibarius]|uniref:DUF1259 domain-containing protein n=2 Tax=Salicibibacter cibarius TaxID=2743000 RepID=A0A7T6Z7V5_9BACI|nr:DUF1259 domain-containing protein [Salicibibacter cibarius]
MDELYQGYEDFRSKGEPKERKEKSLCHEFASIVHGKGKEQVEKGTCSVDLTRDFHVTIEGKDASSVLVAHLSFGELDNKGNALNLSEVTVLETEVFPFSKALLQQELTVSAIHNHWIYTDPTILYIHVQSVEPPINFAKKMAKAFSALKSFPVSSG